MGSGKICHADSQRELLSNDLVNVVADTLDDMNVTLDSVLREMLREVVRDEVRAALREFKVQRSQPSSARSGRWREVPHCAASGRAGRSLPCDSSQLGATWRTGLLLGGAVVETQEHGPSSLS